MSTSKTYDFVIEESVRFDKRITWKDSTGTPIDLTGYTAQMMIKKRITDTSPVIELNTTNSRITLGGAAGTIDLLISSADTDGLDLDVGVYDLEMIEPGGERVRLLEGKVTLSPAVTT